jgi:hypothetical protein
VKLCLSRRGLLSGAAAVAVGPFIPAATEGQWVTYHPNAPRVMTAACRAIQEAMREMLRADIISGRVFFPPALSREFGFTGHKQRDTGGEV